MREKIIFILLLTWLFCTGAAAPPSTGGTQVSISVSENLAFIGDRIRLKFIVKTTSEVDDIIVKTTAGEFDILDDKIPTQKRTEQDALIFEKHIDIAFFKTGDFNVGPFVLELEKNAKVIESRETNSVPVTVKTTLKEEDKDIKPLKDLVEIQGNPWYFLKYILFVGLAAVAIVFILSRLKKRKAKTAETSKPLLSPLEELDMGIKELYGQSLLEKGKFKLFFLELTVILKQFLHRNYQFNAEDFTTYETLYDLKGRESEAVLLNNLESLFSTADLVKFAKYVPDTGLLTELEQKIGATIGIYRARDAAAAAPMQGEKVS